MTICNGELRIESALEHELSRPLTSLVTLVTMGSLFQYSNDHKGTICSCVDLGTFRAFLKIPGCFLYVMQAEVM